MSPALIRSGFPVRCSFSHFYPVFKIGSTLGSWLLWACFGNSEFWVPCSLTSVDHSGNGLVLMSLSALKFCDGCCFLSSLLGNLLNYHVLKCLSPERTPYPTHPATTTTKLSTIGFHLHWVQWLVMTYLFPGWFSPTWLHAMSPLLTIAFLTPSSVPGI